MLQSLHAADVTLRESRVADLVPRMGDRYRSLRRLGKGTGEIVGILPGPAAQGCMARRAMAREQPPSSCAQDLPKQPEGDRTIREPGPLGTGPAHPAGDRGTIIGGCWGQSPAAIVVHTLEVTRRIGIKSEGERNCARRPRVRRSVWRVRRARSCYSPSTQLTGWSSTGRPAEELSASMRWFRSVTRRTSSISSTSTGPGCARI